MVENNCDECGVPIPKSEVRCPPCERRWQALVREQEKYREKREKHRKEWEKNGWIFWITAPFCFIIILISAIIYGLA
jgi:predicted ATP-dependent serine protease